MKLFILLALLVSGTAHADTTLADDVIGNLYVMRSVYKAEYAPAQWKKTYANYDLDTEFNKAIAAVQANPNLTLKQSREILKTFIYAMKDYHTSIRFVSTEAASLPFSVKGTDDRFFIMYIDRTKLPLASFPFNVGDELVTFDNQPTAQAVAAVQAEIPANVPTTDKALAEIYLTSRKGTKAYNIPQGPITIGVKAKGSDTVAQFQMVWDYTPETVNVRGNLGLAPMPVPAANSMSEPLDGVATPSAVDASASTFKRPQMSVDFDAPSADNPYDLGGRKTFTPDLGTKIWASADGDVFYAYIYKNAQGKLIGYLRIPQYETTDYVAAVAEFGRDIALFESSTDAMVIDQANNPGGSVPYLYALASMLATQPLQTPVHRMSITQADILNAQNEIQKFSGVKTDADAQKVMSLTDTDGYPVSYELVQFSINFDRFIVNEWNAGRKLTNPYFISGVDHINPAATHYTKPILLLINHLDFSGGDFFPTILQDNKRVVVMGGRTAGAGGYVNDVQVPNNIGVDAFRCTESIAERVNLNPIENLGVTPDVGYEMTADDFANNYTGYVSAVQVELASLTSGAGK